MTLAFTVYRVEALVVGHGIAERQLAADVRQPRRAQLGSVRRAAVRQHLETFT